MSLLLLFPSSAVTVDTGWHIVVGSNATWSLVNYDFKDRWGDWSLLTWGTVATLTWAQMAGFTFTNTTGNSTTWTRVT